MKKLPIVASLSVLALLAIGLYMLKNDHGGSAPSGVSEAGKAPSNSANLRGTITKPESSEPGTSLVSPSNQSQRLPSEKLGPNRSHSGFLAALRKNDLFGAFVDAANAGGIEGASTAAYISSVCLPYTKGRSKPFDLPDEHLRRLTANGEKNIAASRERLSEAMLERCRGFSGTDRYMTTLKAVSANLKQAGVDELFSQSDSTAITEGKSLAIDKVFQNPDSYLGVLMVNTNEIFPRLGSNLGGDKVTAIEARLAFEVGMCQLGVDCARDSVGSMNACIVSGVCSENSVQDKAAIVAKAYGADFERITKMGDTFAAGVQRADKSVLGYKP